MEIVISACKEGKKKVKEALKKVSITPVKKNDESEDDKDKSKENKRERTKEEFM